MEITFEWEPKKRADHKRSYESHRRHFLQGDLERGWKPRLSFYQFPTFDEYQATVERHIREAIQAEAQHVVPDLEKALIKIYGTSDYSSKAVYWKSFNKGKGVVIGYHLDGIEEVTSPDNKQIMRDLSISTAHELRHHDDRRMVRYRSNLYSEIQNRDKPKQEALKYLMTTRTEGLAQFDPREHFYLHGAHDEGIKIGIGQGFTLNQKRLQEKTAKVDRVFAFFAQPMPLREYEMKWGGGYEGNGQPFQPDERKWQFALWEMKQKEKLCPYAEGNDLFAIIRKAEMKRRTGLARPIETGVYPEDISFAFFREILEKVKAQKSFTEFYDYYYDCAREMALAEDEMIIRPQHAQKIIDLENEPFNVEWVKSIMKSPKTAQ